ncbi:MAG: hypothetical protein Unbinned6486contig1001_6 [Prokaryotic dsDNA virus sp.]|nr:MAG: hypothetical protein Unbinned6486contig1001_6 [Prokaryotic dsDNA virus sp.]|tara:strand:+ start:18223 stop:18810 length:588 start_codon:yes stop_codon:yes gene_type:complete
MAEQSLIYKNTTKVFNTYGKLVLKRAKRNLKIKKKVDGKYITADGSGALANSLYYKINLGKKKLNIKFLSSLDYADFMEQGVQGSGRFQKGQRNKQIKQSAKNSPYKFRKKNISKGVLRGMIESPRFKMRDGNGKFIKKTPQSIKSAEYLIGRSIATTGLSARGYMKSAIEETKKRFILNVKEGLVKDLVTGLNL